MKIFLLFLCFAFSAFAEDEAFLKMVAEKYPEAIREEQVVSAREISNSTKRVPRTETRRTVDRDKLLEQMMIKMNDGSH
jgi:hypothetical protein